MIHYLLDMIFGVDPGTITTIGTAIAGIITAWGAYRAGKRKQTQDDQDQKHSIEQDAQRALMELNAANKTFRDEIRADLLRAQERIAVLESLVMAKDKKILDLEYEVQRLRAELERFQRENK